MLISPLDGFHYQTRISHPANLEQMPEPTLEAVLVMESRARYNPGSWTRMFQAGSFHIFLTYHSVPTGGTLEGQIISISRLKLQPNVIHAAYAVGMARLETEFGQVEVETSINANGDFVLQLEQPVLYPLDLRLTAPHGVVVGVADLELF